MRFARVTSRVGSLALPGTAPSMSYVRKSCESELSESIPADSTLEQTAMERLDGERARAAMGRLPDEQRSLLELGFFGDMTHDAIARQTGLPLGTVKTRIRSGLRRLRELLHVAVL
jgi:RNA polymerase sigma factor (sigma-70 family)